MAANALLCAAVTPSTMLRMVPLPRFAYGIHTSQIAGAHPFPSLLGKVARDLRDV